MPDPYEAPSPAMVKMPIEYPTREQQRLLWTALTSLAVLALLGVAGLVFMGVISFLSWAYPVLLPIGLAVIIALVLEPVVDFMQRIGIKRRVGTLTSCLLALVAFCLFWVYLLPPLVSYGGQFIRLLPGLLNQAVAKLEDVGSEPAAVPASPADASPRPLPAGAVATGTSTNQVVAPAPPPPVPSRSLSTHSHRLLPQKRPVFQDSEMKNWVMTNLPLVQQSIQTNVAHLVYSAVGPVGQALGFLLGFGFVPIYVYYFLVDQENIARHWQEYVPLRASPVRTEVVSVLTEINQVLVKYFRGQIIVAACNGVLTSIGLLAVDIPFALILGIMTGALSIVPFLGIIASIVPALLLAYISSQGWIKPVLVLGVFALVQMSESMFITPRVQSHSTGLHPITIIVGILFWSMLLPGLLGPVVAVPLTCAVVVLLRRYVWQKPVNGS